jgi:hypothetical protein
MTMSYELTSRTIALDPEAVATRFPALLAQYGEALPDGAETITTIGGHWDDSAQTRIRAASLHKGTITGQPLTDGRVAFTCLWQADLAAAFDRGDIAGGRGVVGGGVGGADTCGGGSAVSYLQHHLSTVERGRAWDVCQLGLGGGFYGQPLWRSTCGSPAFVWVYWSALSLYFRSITTCAKNKRRTNKL